MRARLRLRTSHGVYVGGKPRTRDENQPGLTSGAFEACGEKPDSAVATVQGAWRTQLRSVTEGTEGTVLTRRNGVTETNREGLIPISIGMDLDFYLYAFGFLRSPPLLRSSC